ncbi:membrane protein [Rugosimonospora acidiphila]|uniref:Membrane protein n=1 Tax=Rugosimonospora acidiphila TaxID=556531 RepID=A0ABP9RNW3_9ACTN
MIDSVDQTGAPAAPATSRPTLLDGAAIALLLYATTRVVQLVFITWLAPGGGPSIKDRLLAWDGGWFIRVATEGYPHTYTYDDKGVMVGNGLAFFPLYPGLIHAVHWLGTSYDYSAIGISWAAAGVASVLLYRFGAVLHSPRLGYALVVLFCAQPMSVVLSMAYSEALFSALVLGALYAAYRERFLVAGVLGLAAGLCRPTGLAVGLAVVVAAVVALRAGRGGWRAVTGAVLAVVGVPAYLVWVGLRVGDLRAWFTIQTAGWGTTFDWGSSTWTFLETAFHQGNSWVQMSVAFILVAAVVAVVLAVVRRTWLPLTVYGLLSFASVVGQAGYYHSKPRLLIPVLLTLLPAGYAAARARPVVATLALTGYAAFGLWYGAYMITVWQFTI